MSSKKYPLPGFLNGRCTSEAYVKWLSRRAIAHVKRDRKREYSNATRETYMKAIHESVNNSEGFDYYTGEPLAWEIISTYDNATSKEGRRIYKRQFWNLPTVDHFGEDTTSNAFRICAWRTNDCKNDLSQEELVEFCRLVLAYQKKAPADPSRAS